MTTTTLARASKSKSIIDLKRPLSLPLLITVVLFFLGQSIYAQSTCATAINIGSSSGDTATFSGSDVWFKFQASDTAHIVQIGIHGQWTPEFYVNAYSGSCGSLSLIEGQDTITAHNDLVQLLISGLTASTYYYVKLSPANSGQTYVQSVAFVPPCSSCQSSIDPCERICNGDWASVNISYYNSNLIIHEVCLRTELDCESFV